MAKAASRGPSAARAEPMIETYSEDIRQGPAGAAEFVTVIVPVRNEAPFIEGTLRQILRQDYDGARFEVLVIDGDSSDGTPEIVRRLLPRHPNLRLLHNPRRLSSAARNVGVRQARGGLVVVVDGHCELDNPRYLRDLAEAFTRSGADCIGRPQPLDVTGATSLQRGIAAARSSRLGHHPASFIYASAERFVPPQSVAVAYRRSVFEAVGLFDENFDACEDLEFNHRVDHAGLRCFFTPKVRVRYYPRSNLRGLFKQMVRYARGRVRLLRKHPETFSVPCFVPAAFVLGLVAGPPLAWASPWLAAIYAGVLAAYALTVAATSLTLAARDHDPWILPWLPLIFVTIHVGTGFGALSELIRPGAAAPSSRPAVPAS